jgi:FkbM family methyltransferase
MSNLYRKSYSQFCEDLLIESSLGRRDQVTYIDIGCLWPVQLSNTYIFYEAGGSGLCIDPNPTIAAQYAAERPRDIFYNAGVSDHAGELTYSMFQNPVFNTFDARRRARVIAKGRTGTQLIDERVVPVRPLRDILDEVDWWTKHPTTDLLCIDVEGHEVPVLQSADLARLRPQLIVCELFGGAKAAQDSAIVRFLAQQSYEILAYTGHDVFMKRVNN